LFKNYLKLVGKRSPPGDAEVFCVAEQWALDQMAEVRSTGQAKTMLGAIRHLRDNLNSPDKGVANKAERQGLSIMIQGSAAEQTKLVEGAVWNAGILDKFDCSYIASIHDEIVRL
jgi:DNA polymerase-1